MKRNWKDIKWIFEPDGSLIDLYVQEVSLNDWKKVIRLLNKKFKVKYNETNQIDENYLIKYLTDMVGEMESKSASIFLNEIQINCHFFLSDQIEFDIDPKEINSISDFESIEKFMIDISTEVDNQVILTGENNPKFPLVKIDSNKKINKVLSESEVNQYRENQNSILNRIKSIKTNIEMKLAPNRFKEKLLKSTNELYKSTKKEENVW
ncbi:hypothetical protein [uncultured Arcticibacterium sp.]|uniref:hypothetical protein n=1 Tax=uncultured Arcticibacterium sp. TaxID=2173042 RepID=UPI0030F936AB